LRLLVDDCRIVADGGGQIAHRAAEPLLEFGSLRVGVLEHVMRHAGGDTWSG
jgi:hypothetical protein